MILLGSNDNIYHIFIIPNGKNSAPFFLRLIDITGDIKLLS